MKLKRLVSAVLAVGMALTMLPTAAFAADATTPVTPIEITNLKFDTDGLPIVPAGQENTTYIYSENGKQQYAVANKRSYLAIRKDHMLVGPGDQIIKANISNVGTLNGGFYGGTVTVDGGAIWNGFFMKTVTRKNNDPVSGGVFSNDIKVAGERTLTATGCNIYTEESMRVSEDAYISNKAYIVGDQKMVLIMQALTQTGWKVNGMELDMENPTNTVLQNVSVSSDENNVNVIAFTMPQEDVTIEPVATPVEFKLGTNGVPEYNGKEYLGNAQLDGWHLTVTETRSVLRIEQGYTVDLENNCVDWAIQNCGILKNGITPGNVVNYKNEDGTYGRVENIAFKMNVNFGDQDTNITWMTVKNAMVNDVFSDIVGVIGTQTLTVKATVSPFDGWSYSGTVSEDVAKQIEAQKNNETLTLTLTGEEGKADTIALTAKTTGDTFDMTLVDGTASVDGKEVTAAQKGQTVTLTAADAPDGMVFDRWEITPSDVALTLEEAGFDSHAATASFKMPAQTLNIRAMYRMADQPEEPNVLGTVAMVATAGVGAAVVGYTGYMIGTELYLNTVLPEGVAIPNNTTELAKLLWTDAGKPAPAAVLAADATDEQKALTWAVENQLISADKAADASVGRWEVIDAWNKAQEMKKV